MRITINVPRRVIYMAGAAHDLSRSGCNRLLIWLMANAALLWGWENGEYVFQVEVTE